MPQNFYGIRITETFQYLTYDYRTKHLVGIKPSLYFRNTVEFKETNFRLMIQF